MRRNSDPALWFMGLSLLAVGVMVTMHVRKAKAATQITQDNQQDVDAPNPVKSSQPKFVEQTAPNAKRFLLHKDLSYLVNFTFKDSSVVPEIDPYLRMLAKSWQVVGSSSISLTVRAVASHTFYQDTPKTITTASGRSYTVAAIKRG